MKKIICILILFSSPVYSQQNFKLNKFVEIYSQVRYFYPTNQITEEKWDEILLSGIEMCLNSNDSNFTTNVSTFFRRIAPMIKISNSDRKTKQIINKKNQVFWQYKGFNESVHGLYDHRLINSGDYKQNSGLSCWFDEKLVLQDASIKIFCSAKSDSKEKTKLLLQFEAFNYSTKKDSIIINEVPLKKQWSDVEIEFKLNQGKSYITLLTNIIGKGKADVKNLRIEININDKVYIKRINFEHSDVKQIETSTLRSPFGFTYNLDSSAATLSISRNLNENPELFCSIAPKPNSWKSIKIDDQNYIHIPVSVSKKMFNKNIVNLSQLSKVNQDYNFQIVKFAPLLKTYCIFNLFYPYKTELNVDFNELLVKYLEKVKQSSSETEVYTVIKEYVAEYKDGHAFVHNDILYDSRCVSADFTYLSGELYVRGSSENSFLEEGDRVISVNAVPVKEIFEKRLNSRAGSIQWKYNRETLIFGCGDSLEIDDYTIIRKNDTLTGRVKKDGFAGSYLKNKFEPVTDLKDSIFYIDLSRVSYSHFITLIDTLKNAKGIIFDMREYPIIAPELLSHFTDEKLISANWQIPILSASSISVMDTSFRWNIPSSPLQLHQKIVFLINSGTISYGESLLDIIKFYNLGTVIGEKSAGINGNKTSFTAPGGYKIYFTGMYVSRIDGTSFFAKGIEPDIYYEEIYNKDHDNLIDFSQKYLQDLIKK